MDQEAYQLDYKDGSNHGFGAREGGQDDQQGDEQSHGDKVDEVDQRPDSAGQFDAVDQGGQGEQRGGQFDDVFEDQCNCQYQQAENDQEDQEGEGHQSDGQSRREVSSINDISEIKDLKSRADRPFHHLFEQESEGIGEEREVKHFEEDQLEQGFSDQKANEEEDP